jgi:hypothetical protein
MTSLEDALSKHCPAKLLEQLAVAHVTIGRYLTSIVDFGEIRLNHCSIFDCDLLYFSYGAPYYRPANHQTQDALELPVVLVFDPAALSQFSRFYPFDTGGVMRGVFGDDWQKKLSNLDELYVTSQPERLVSCFYETNPSYLKGVVTKTVPATEPLKVLHRFLREDLSDLGSDQRQRTIECIAEMPIEVFSGLRWVAYPTCFSKQIARLWGLCYEKFDWFTYEEDVNDNPFALVTLIRQEMRKKFSFLHTSPANK